MPETTPDALPWPSGPDEIAPLEERFEDIAVATQTALLRPASFGNAQERDLAIPTPLDGMRIFRLDRAWLEQYIAAPTIGTGGWYPVWGRMPSFRNVTNGSQTLVNATWAAVGLTAGTNTTHGGFTINPTNRPVVPFPGIYSFDWGFTFSGNNGGNARAARLLIDDDGGGNAKGTERNLRGGNYSTAAMAWGTSWTGPVEQSVRFEAYQNSGADLSVSLRNSFVRYVGPL